MLAQIEEGLASAAAKDAGALGQIVQRCILVLEQSTQSFAIMWVGGYLKKLIATQQSQIPLADLVAINNTVIRRISQPSFSGGRASLNVLCSISAAVTVLGWGRSEEVFANALLPSDGTSYPQNAWVLLLQAVVQEMSQEKSILKGFPKHRKTAVSFRDSHLLSIFRGGSQMFRDSAASGTLAQQPSFARNLLLLLIECLSFDFIGINPDESSDDQGSVHIPTNWKEDIQDQMFLSVLCNSLISVPDCQPEILDTLASIFCTRRSLFSDSEREQFTATNLQVLRDILNFFDSLSEDGQHRLYRLISRFLSVYSSDALKSANGEEFVRLFMARSVSSIPAWHDAQIIHIVQAWNRLVDSSGSAASDLGTKYGPYVVAVAQALIRFDGKFGRDSEELLSQVLDSCANVIRFDYANVADMLSERFKSSANAFISGSPGPERSDSAALSCSWPTLLIAAVIGARAPYQLSSMDLINTANRGTLFRDELELSLIYFALQFKRSYLCDTGSRRAALFETVAQYCSISSQDQATISIFDKLLVNLRFATSSLVLEKTMEAFTDFTSGSVTSKMLKKSQVIIFLVQNHSSEHFSRITDQKLLQQFFAGITKLLILESDESFDKELYIFLAPLQTNIEQYKGMSDSELLEPVVRAEICKLFRKLRQAPVERLAIMSVFVAKKHFQPFFDLDDNVAALRFFHEFVWNKSGRLNFDVNSASGVVIFREVSQVANEIGLALIKSDLASIPESQYWPKVFKRISIILNLLKNILGGRYVCFGVFALYNDPVLANTLSVMFGLSRFIEARYLLARLATLQAFLGVWAVFTGEQLMLVEDLDIETFSHVLECCNAAILDLSAHSLVSSQACTIIDNIFTHVCQRHIRGKAPDVIFARVQQTAHHCRALLATLFDKLVNEDPPNQWSMTRPLLPLVLLFSDFFQSYVEQLIAEQRSQNQEAFGNAILSVMEGVTLSLETRNRDRFTTNVSHVRRRILLEASSPS
ncbi:hypothetical protein HK105_207457 [Polyrhizophydium stewartii]|uniref:Exportin-7/Ran-binding protein 17 TPR repeats domain-containing protein n=1 Tax=Polyrhizophydium stewartii TaxID=2732419 RepID=A0ABR4N0E9_9FUNG